VMVWLAGCGRPAACSSRSTRPRPTASRSRSTSAREVESAPRSRRSSSSEHLHDGSSGRSPSTPSRSSSSRDDRTTTISFVSGGDVDKLNRGRHRADERSADLRGDQDLASVRADVVEVWELVLQPATEQVDSTVGKRWRRGAPSPGRRRACRRSIAPLHSRTCSSRPRRHGLRRLQGRQPEECDDRWHDASTTPSLDRLSCLEEHSPDPVFGSSDACLFGAPVCVDGKPRPATTAATSVVLRAEGAVRGVRERPAGYRFECALGLDPIQNAQQVSFVRCEIDVNMAAMPPLVCDQRLIAAAPPAGSLPGVELHDAPAAVHASDPRRRGRRPSRSADLAAVRTNPNATRAASRSSRRRCRESPSIARSTRSTAWSRSSSTAAWGGGADPRRHPSGLPVRRGRHPDCVANPVLIANETITNCLEHAPLPVP